MLTVPKIQDDGPTPFPWCARLLCPAWTDEITCDGKAVGCSTSSVYSQFLRRMISLGHVDTELARPGTKVTVIGRAPESHNARFARTWSRCPLKKTSRRAATYR
jgi:glycine cleavage system aminomethyltransferase T